VIGNAIVAKPAWSPGGRLIAGEGRGLHVAIVRAKDGKLVARIPQSSTGGGGPNWSPSGMLLFSHSNECGIDIAHPDGSHLRRLTAVC
jgi:hypothetical protein